ncbi:MAG: alpha/beta fold hydrolase [Pseudomonadota bacterium]
MKYVHDFQENAQERATVLALHGSASTGKQWRALSDLLEDKANVIAPDLPGYGAAKDDLSDRLVTLLNMISRINEPVHIVAHSFGGAVALRLLDLLPDAVASLTLYDPLVVRNGVLPPKLSSIWHSYGAAEPDALLRGFLNFWGGDGTWEALTEMQRERLTVHVPSLRRDFHEIESGFWDLRDGSFSGPITTLWGGNSPKSTVEMARVLQSAYPQSQHFVLQDLGHLSPLSDAQTVGEHMAACLQQQFKNNGLPACAA